MFTTMPEERSLPEDVEVKYLHFQNIIYSTLKMDQNLLTNEFFIGKDIIK